MEFCECGSLMYPAKEGNTTILKCRRCGSTKAIDDKTDMDSFKIVTEFKHSEKDLIEVVKGNNSKVMPSTHVRCKKCGHNEAFYWQVQTRSADEGMTTFYRCKKCKYTWRSY